MCPITISKYVYNKLGIGKIASISIGSVSHVPEGQGDNIGPYRKQAALGLWHLDIGWYGEYDSMSRNIIVFPRCRLEAPRQERRATIHKVTRFLKVRPHEARNHEIWVYDILIIWFFNFVSSGQVLI